jgi:hypothetical protein
MKTLYSTGQTKTADEAPPDRRVRELIAALREHYTRHFGNRWFERLLTIYGFNPDLMQDIRLLFELHMLVPADYRRIDRGIRALGELVYFCRMRVMPELQRELGIAGFAPRAYRGDEVSRMAKEWFLASLPANLGKIVDLAEELRDQASFLERAV